MHEPLKERKLSFVYAFRGVRGMIREEPNFLIHLAIAACVLIAGVLLDITRSDWVVLVIVTGMVLAAETFNAAIEKLSDMVTREHHPVIEKVKDRAAGAVVIMAVAAALTGLLVFIPYLL